MSKGICYLVWDKTLRALMGAREQRLSEPWMEGRIVERWKEYIAHGTNREQLGTRQGEQLGTRNESRRMRMKLKVLPRNRNYLRKVTQDPKPLSSLHLLCSKVVPSLSVFWNNTNVLCSMTPLYWKCRVSSTMLFPRRISPHSTQGESERRASPELCS